MNIFCFAFLGLFSLYAYASNSNNNLFLPEDFKTINRLANYINASAAKNSEIKEMPANGVFTPTDGAVVKLTRPIEELFKDHLRREYNINLSKKKAAIGPNNLDYYYKYMTTGKNKKYNFEVWKIQRNDVIYFLFTKIAPLSSGKFLKKGPTKSIKKKNSKERFPYLFAPSPIATLPTPEENIQKEVDVGPSTLGDVRNTDQNDCLTASVLTDLEPQETTETESSYDFGDYFSEDFFSELLTSD